MIWLVVPLIALAAIFFSRNDNRTPDQGPAVVAAPDPVPEKEVFREIDGNIGKGETLFDIFKRYGLDIAELFHMKEASASVHRLKDLRPGRQYRLVVDSQNRVNSFTYWINDDTTLRIVRDDEDFVAETIPVPYDRKVVQVSGVISDNLISSIGESREKVLLAMDLSDVFAWDIDFSTDLRQEDSYRIAVEGLYLDGEFRKYGSILTAEFINNGKTYRAYRFEVDGKGEYFDAEGQSLRKAFLKAPLNFRRISSSFTGKRFHPILKVYRPHRGVDYSAAAGTPVSAVGDGTVVHAGYKGQYGKLVIIRHPNGYSTYYGHLSRIGKGVGRGAKVVQGQVIGSVGSTGLATGPHLHYEMRRNNTAINPLKLEMPRSEPVPKDLRAEFFRTRDYLDEQLSIAEMEKYVMNSETERTAVR